MPSTQILVVDSDRDRALAVADRARSKAWEVRSAIGAEAALEAIREGAISVVLVDASIWREHGLSEALATTSPGMPVIVLAQRDEDRDDLVKQLRLGAMTYVPRDADARRIVDTLKSIIDLSRHAPHRERVREFLRSGEVELHLANDPALIAIVIAYLQRILEDYGLIDDAERARLAVALSEAISNAMIHGNLEVDSSLRDDDPGEYFRAIDERRARTPYAERRVQIVMRFTQSSATFVVRDQGVGFDRSALADPTEDANVFATSGRGILLMRAYTDAVSWNESGNEVTLVKTLRPS